MLVGGSYTSSPGLVWQGFVHLPNVRVQNLRLRNTTKRCLWEILLVWYFYYYTSCVSVIWIFTCSNLMQLTALHPSH